MSGAGDSKLGRFDLEQPLGPTRWGVRYAARDPEGRRAEVEVIAASGEQRALLAALVEREVDVGRRLAEAGTRGLLRAVACGEAPRGELFVARERPAGLRPLDARLLAPSPQADLEGRAWLLLAAARRVEALGEQRVVHRDLGPHALWCDGEDEVLLAALALAKVPGVPEPPLDPRGLPLGYLAGAAPEVLEDPAAATPAADVFTLGVLLHLALTGAPPWPGPTLGAHLRQRLEATRLPALADPHLPQPLVDLCARALACEPGRRIGSPTAFAERLEDWLAVGADATPLGGPLAPAEEDAEDTEPFDLRLPLPEQGPPAAAAEPEEQEDSEETDRLSVPIPSDAPQPAPAARPALWDPFASDERPAPSPDELQDPAQRPDLPPPHPGGVDLGALDLSAAAEPPAANAPPPRAAPPLPSLPAAEPLAEPEEPLPPVAFERLRPEGQLLILTVRGDDVHEAAETVRRLDAAGFAHLLLDLREAEHLGGAQLEALTEVLTHAERRGLSAGMFGLRSNVRQVLRLLDDMATQMPRVLAAADEAAAIREVLEG